MKRYIIAAFCVFFIILSCSISFAYAAPQDLSISVQWMDASGTVRLSDPAVPVTDAPDETRFWITLPSDAPLTGLTLNISDLSGGIAFFLPGQGEALKNVTDAGGSLDYPGVEIIACNAAGEMTAVYSLYLSYMPLLQEPVYSSATVTVHYTDEYNQPLLPDQTLSLEAGTHTVSAQDIPGYSLISPPSFSVTVEGGSAYPSDITFSYNRYAIMANVTVRYLDENGWSLLPDQTMTLNEGREEIYAPAIDGYDLQGQSVRTVSVDASGAIPTEITFQYTRRVLSGTVTVHCVDENGYPLMPDQTLTFNESQATVYAFPIEGYSLTSAGSCPITVDQNGAYPSEVTFYYSRIASSANVTVHYVDEYGYPLINDVIYTYDAGQHTVTAAAIDQYVPTGSTAYTVTVDENGVTPAEITFTYTRYIPPATITVHYVDENGYSLLPDAYVTLEGGSHILMAETIDGYVADGPGAQTAEITLEGAVPGEITFRYTREVLPTDVLIHYVDDTGSSITEDRTQTVQPGYNQVYPNIMLSPDLYLPAEPAYYEVNVTADGADPAEITFTCRRAVQPVDVRVRYVDERGETVAPDDIRTFGEGEHMIYPSANISAADYLAAEPAYYLLTVSLEGGSFSEVTFTYRRTVKPAMVTVHYTDAQGTPVADDTQQWFEGGSFVVFPQPVNLLDRYYHASGDPEFQTVTVDADGAHPDSVTFLYEYIPADPVTLPVYYRDAETGMDVAQSGTATVPSEATTAVSARPENLLPDYVLSGEPTVYVTVNAEGEADVSEVVFLYQYVEPTPAPTEEPTPEPTEEPTAEPTAEPTPEPGPVMVPVRYVDPDGIEVASPGQVWCALGDTEIAAAPADLKDGYQPDSPQSVLVHVDESGPVPAEIVFTYRLTVEPPAPKVALVSVKYLSPAKEVFFSYSATCVEGQENKVEVDWSQVDSALAYELDSDAAVYVSVDETGAASPAEVVFRFRNEINAYVTIRYQDASTGRDVATPQQEMCYVGANTVDARPLDLEDNYLLVSASSVTVILDSDGRLTPAEAVFLYSPAATPTPEPQTLAYDMPMDTYFYPTGTAIRVRSTPTTAEDNIIAMVNSGDLGHAMGRVTGKDGKVWYAVEIKGIMGYMSETVVRFLSEAEIAALFNYTLMPTAEPTPQPSSIPDGAVIDRWGSTTALVNFRRNSDRSAKIITELKKNSRVWIFSSQTVNGEKWYAVRYNGTDGYVMADYVQLAGEEESAAIQAQLSSPMPTQTPTLPPATPTPTAAPTEQPTAVPTLEPTLLPTAVPEASAVPTETPSPYRGYALTNTQAALRTGVSMTDDSILEMLPSQSLMIVNGQTYVDGVAWASAQALGSGNLGFILQSALTSITAEEARPYLEVLQPTPTPTALPAEQTEGLAMTLGEGVPMRNFPDTNGEIITLLPYMAVAQVRGQQYVGNTAWHLVQYNGIWGYIRQDQLRMMSQEETMAYEQALAAGTPTPSPAPIPTPEPVTQNSVSSYGHVQSTSGRVNMRSEPTTKNNNAIRLLENYAFALVLGSVTNDEGTWYYVSQGGSEGYIRGDYFHVLTLGELSEFLQSSEYQNANSSSAATGTDSSQIQPVEDYNQTVWQNPALNASYEPFNPYATPTPDLERLPTETPTPTPSPSPTPEIAPVSPQNNTIEPEINVQEAGSPWPWVILGLAAVGGGGAYYAYVVRKQNEKRRQAMRAQQARAARNAAAGQPQMRAAQNNPGQNQARPAYPNQSAPFMPPQGGVPQAAPDVSQGTSVYRSAGTASQAAPNVPQGTGVYRPSGTDSQPAAKGETSTYPPVQQATRAYQSPRQETKVYAPVQQTQVFGSPAATRGAVSTPPRELDAVSQDSQTFRPAPVDFNSGRLKLHVKTAQPQMEELPSQNNEDFITVPRKRVRRTERNKNLYDESGPEA